MDEGRADNARNLVQRNQYPIILIIDRKGMKNLPEKAACVSFMVTFKRGDKLRKGQEFSKRDV